MDFRSLESWISKLRNDDQALHIPLLTSRPVGSPGGQDDRGGPPPGGGRPLQGDDDHDDGDDDEDDDGDNSCSSYGHFLME